MEEETPVCKVVVLGNTGVGKTSIIQQFDKNIFDTTNAPTIGSSYVAHTMKEGSKEVVLHIWDTAGQERFRSVVPAYVRGAQAALLVYSADSNISANQLPEWLNILVSSNDRDDASIYVVANKIDLDKLDALEIGRSFAEEHKFRHFEMTAKQLSTVMPLFEAIAADFFSKPPPVSVITPPKPANKPQSSCNC